MQSLQKAKNNQIKNLKRDNYSTKNAWILRDGNLIFLATQKSGEEASGEIKIEKKDFDKLIKFYTSNQ